MIDIDAQISVPFRSESLGRDQTVIGKRCPSFADLDEFRGIPFGHIPGRWKRSKLRTELPADRFEAFKNGPKCPQPEDPNNSDTYLAGLQFDESISQSELECLNLFIIRPSQEALRRIGAQNQKLPVLIWIHGGGYAFGAGTDPMWDPSGLVQRSIDVGKPFIGVNLNYRLNYFGFAASSELLEDQPFGCNFGLYDQKVGIKWVSQHIGAFGGDSNKITIGGQSAGAASTNVHALDAKSSAGTAMFRRVIMQSGSVGCLGPTPLDQAQSNWNDLCKHFGLEVSSPESNLDALRKVSAEDLLAAARVLGWETFPVVLDERSLRSTTLGCGAEVDLDLVGKNEVDRSGEPPLEIMIGDCAAEGAIFISESKKKIHCLEDAHAIFHEAYSDSTACKEVLEGYGLIDVSDLNQIHDRLTQFLSDSMFGAPLYKARIFFSEYEADNKVRRTTVKPFKVRFGNPFKASKNYDISHHCVELIYLFDAFHKHLDETDQAQIQSEGVNNISTEMSPGSSASSTTVNSEVGSPAVSPEEVDKLFFQSPSPLTNREFGNQIQQDWIDFITKDDDIIISGKELEIIKDPVTIYDKDHIIRVESISENQHMKAEDRRCSILLKHPEGARKVMMVLMKGSM